MSSLKKTCIPKISTKKTEWFQVMTFEGCVLRAVFAGKNTSMITQSYLSEPLRNCSYFKNVIDCTWRQLSRTLFSTNIVLWIKILTCNDLFFSLSRCTTEVDLHLTDTSRWVTSRNIWYWIKAVCKFSFVKSRIRTKLSISKTNWTFPFSAAFARVEAVIFCLKKWWTGDEIDPEAEYVLNHIDLALLFEAVLESAPQFIIQFYAISVQEEPATIIQIISLPISFLTLVWAFTATDKTSLAEREIIPSSGALKVKHQLALYVTYLILLSSRLFAICYFTVSYKWWIIGVLMFHSCAVVIATVIQNRDEVGCNFSYVLSTILFMGIHCLRDDFVELSIGVQVGGLTMSMYFSHIFLY